MSAISAALSRVDDALADPVQLLDVAGERHPNELLDPYLEGLDTARLTRIYRDMSVMRRLDAEGVALQRQGQLGLWAPAQGQEAAQIGSAHALRREDVLFPTYRELGMLVARGADPGDYVRVWRGESGAGYDPATMHMAPMQIIIGAQTLHAVGYAMGIQRDGGAEVAVACLGDGATSQGDANEALVFAAAFQTPVVFLCQNNQWAISEPAFLQSRTPLALRAPGFGVPSMRVDGNDVLACYAAMRWASDRARRGEGPAFIEAVTYRMGAHTTADDPGRYRAAEEVESWRARDPIDRMRAYLRARELLTDAAEEQIRAEADDAARAMRAACLEMPEQEALTVFDAVYAAPHQGLAKQRADFASYLAGFEED